jgi:hypothetical protein
VHDTFALDLVYDCFAGTAAHDKPLNPGELVGPEPIFFFAPIQIKKRNADWTPQGLQARYAEAEAAFYARASNPDDPWMTLVHHTGFNGAKAVVSMLHTTGGNPAEGAVVKL